MNGCSGEDRSSVRMGVVSCVESEHDEEEEHHKETAKTTQLSEKLPDLLCPTLMLRRLMPQQLELPSESAIDVNVNNVNRHQRQVT